jgi:uncharacterized protein (DUF2252 family)
MTSPVTHLPIGDHPSPEDRIARGKTARTMAPRSSHAEWDTPAHRRNPVDLIEEQAITRLQELVPVRHGRMVVSPFTYYRGAALPMTADLATTPTSGLNVQLCGDAHLCNFGVFGSPERHLSFDVNDFDETAPGPWEWDVKRLAASLEVAGRDGNYSSKERRRVVRASVRTYRETMRELAQTSMLEVWYAHLDMDELLPRFHSMLDAHSTPKVWRAITKARAHDSMQAFDKLCFMVDGEPRILSDPPLLVPVEMFMVDMAPDEVIDAAHNILRGYRATLTPERRHLLEQYRFIHLARKVVGVGSVGMDAWIALLVDRDTAAPLLLQLKEAEASVIERFTADSEYEHHGERVVVGQRLMQAASDIFLGWERFTWRGVTRDYYIRQLRDWKGSADIAGMTPQGMLLWGQMCGWTLARAHARTGDRLAIAAYLGSSESFEAALVEFSSAYADQNERDHDELKKAVKSGRLEAATGI